MQQKYVNAFCVNREGVIKENLQANVKSLNILTDDPFETALQMREAGLDGKIIVSPELVLDGKIKKLKDLSFPIAVYVDLLECDEKALEELSMLNIPVVIPLFENLQRTGEISAKYDTSPAKLIEDMGFLDRDCTIVGGMYADKDDLDILGGYGAKMVLCPIAYAKRGGTFANVKLMKKHSLILQMGSFDEKINFEKEIEFLYLTSLALLENDKAVTKKEIEKIATGEDYED